MNFNGSTRRHKRKPSSSRRNNKKKAGKKWILRKEFLLPSFPILLFSFLLAVGVLFDGNLIGSFSLPELSGFPSSGLPENPGSPDEVVSPEGFEEAPFRLTVLDVGQGLSVFIQSDGQTMLYDGGDREASSFVVSYLENQELDHLDCVAVSHYDADHLSGIVGVLNRFPVSQVLAPDYETSSSIFKSYENALKQRGITPIHPAVGDTFSLGQASFTVLGPSSIVSDSNNNNSLAIRITYGNTSFLLTGDAEHDEEEDICESWGRFLLSDVYVAGHHGSGSSSSWKLLENAIPGYVIISCGKGNSYGHPHDTVMERFETMEIPIYRTDIQGSVSVASDGQRLIWSQEPCNDYTPGD